MLSSGGRCGSSAVFLLCLVVSTTWWIPLADADESTHTYTDGEEVVVWVNKVGPYHNPQEYYPYYKLPFCKPSLKAKNKDVSNSITVTLEGDDVIDSGFAVAFKQNIVNQVACEIDFTTPETVTQLTKAVREHYWYLLYVDDLPIWGMVGEYMVADLTDQDNAALLTPEFKTTFTQHQEHHDHAAVEDTGSSSGSSSEGKRRTQGFVYTHKEFSVSYHGNQIIHVNLTSANPKPISVTEGTVSMTYSVQWVPTDVAFDDRFSRYLDSAFFEHHVHWFSIFNAFTMVLFLCLFVGIILTRTLKQDYIRFDAALDNELELNQIIEEDGWQKLHGDVFRSPGWLMQFSALLGVGTQLLVVALVLLVLAGTGKTHEERGHLMYYVLLVYSLTTFIAGYVSGGYYKSQNGKKWKHTLVVTALVVPLVFCAVYAPLNVIAWYYQSLNILKAQHLMYLVGIVLLCHVPITLVGTLIGRRMNRGPEEGVGAPRVANFYRPILPTGFFTSQPFIALAAGLLPFGSVFIEMYFIFTSFWNYKVYYMYSFILLAYVLLLIATVCVTIVSTYVLLNNGDHRWVWSSFASGASAALYVYLYAIYFLLLKTRMSGVLQYAYFFGYVSIFALGFGLVTGAAGFWAANVFVKKIYSELRKED